MFCRKKYFFLISFCCLCRLAVSAQDQKIADSLARIYEQATLKDSARLELLTELSFNETRDLVKGLQYADELIKSAKKSGSNNFLRRGYFLKGNKKRALGQLDEALEAYIKSAEIARLSHNLKGEGESYGAIADIYSVANNHQNAMLYYRNAIRTLRQSKDSISLASVLANAGDALLKNRNFNSALAYFREAKMIFEKVHYLSGKGYCLGNIGMVYANIGENDLAEKNIDEAIKILAGTQDYYPICVYLISMSDVYLNKGDNSSAVNYALRSLQLAQQYGLKEQLADANLALSKLYENEGNTDESFRYYKNYVAQRDSINNLKTVQRMADLRTNYEVSQKQTEVNLLNQQKQTEKKLSALLGVILVLVVIILAIALRNNQNKHKAYKSLRLQKLKTDEQKAKAENALNELQITQEQLIQSAKMASLGELTAGIAHEIQNPLNFVNNFSEVSVELLDELRQGTANKLSSTDKADADEIINDLAENLKKITEHGKRADSIVKGMLQHSRVAANKKELTNINELADEYLRLSYHGFKAKDNAFNVAIETNFDETFENISVVPQDIGRVFINIYTNAFYSIYEKFKLQVNGYKPTLHLSTKGEFKDGKLKCVQIRIKDNGMGIPVKIIDKIFQPFFTTKPTGQGTGLGLSLSYDIIANEHKGELKVETKEGSFTEFIIELPNKK